MPATLPSSAQKVQAALADKGYSNQVIEMPDTTRSAGDAAAAVGCSVGQIAKSILFRAIESDRPVLVVTSGPNRVAESAVGALVGEKLGKADANFVRSRTGFAIGGVPPIAHAEPVLTYIDEDLMGYDSIWAAAGTPFAVFKLTPQELVALTGGEVSRIKQD